MKISIIDIGTQSIKHYIFEVDGLVKKSIHYKRYSEAHLGEHDIITSKAIQRNISILQECLGINKDHNVQSLQILGTEILRKAENAQDFCISIKDLTGCTIRILTQDQEALLLYKGFIKIVPDGLIFGAMNTGGGSTEIVVGDSTKLIDSRKIPFGVKFLRNKFAIDGPVDWKALDEYLNNEISLNFEVEIAFVTGDLGFLLAIGPHLGFVFDVCNIPNHPIKFSFERYSSFLEILRTTPVDDLKKLYPKDPSYADNFALCHSVYVMVCRKLKARTIIPSSNDLTDGVIY